MATDRVAAVGVGQKRLDVLSQVVFAMARLLDKFRALSDWTLQRRVKDLLDPCQAIRCHPETTALS